MGIRGLQTFCSEHCQGVCEQVNIEQLAQSYQQKTGKQPVIVVDAPSCLRTIYGNTSWVCGGQFKQFQNNCCNFVKRFSDAGIKLIFFFDGPTVSVKRDTWIERRKRSIRDIEHIFDALSCNDFQEQAFSRTMQQPCGLNTYARFIFKFICHCEVHASVDECDYEIAEYARKNDCFAILGQDTDFIILNPTEYYFSAHNLVIETLNTINYNSIALANNLHITVGHLPLFASLMGNDIIPEERLRFFHSKRCFKRSGNKFKNIAVGICNYIRQFPPVGDGLHDFIPRISLEVFGDISMAETLHQSILSYVPETGHYRSFNSPHNSYKSWECVLTQATSKHKSSEIPSSIYGIVKLVPFESSSYMEDFRRLDIPPAGLISRQSRQRLYSVLLSECPRAQVVEEWCVTGMESLEQPYVVHVLRDIKNMIDHPGLQKLWDVKSTDATIVQKRWIIFAWIISPRISAARLRTLPPRLVVPALALFYLNNEVHQTFLKSEECNLFVLIAVCLPEYDSHMLSDLNIERPNSRAVRLTTVFLRLVVHIFNVNGGCGYPVPISDSLPSGYFDGKLFQHYYIKMLSGYNVMNIIQNDSQRKQFREVMDLILLK